MNQGQNPLPYSHALPIRRFKWIPRTWPVRIAVGIGAIIFFVGAYRLILDIQSGLQLIRSMSPQLVNLPVTDATNIVNRVLPPKVLGQYTLEHAFLQTDPRDGWDSRFVRICVDSVRLASIRLNGEAQMKAQGATFSEQSGVPDHCFGPPIPDWWRTDDNDSVHSIFVQMLKSKGSSESYLVIFLHAQGAIEIYACPEF